MKIIKRPDHIVFDTENPDNMEFNPIPYRKLTALHQNTLKSDHAFLKEHFTSKNNIVHPIFINFSNSYYYVVNS